MVQIRVECYNCKKEFTFDTDKTRQKIMKMDKKLPKTFVPNCPFCGEENEVSVE